MSTALEQTHRPDFSNLFPAFDGNIQSLPMVDKFLNLTSEEYYQDVQQMSFHMLKATYQNIDKYGLIKSGWQDPAFDKDYIKFGKMAHKAFLEGPDFYKEYIPFDNTEIVEQIGGARPTATKKYKEWYTNLLAQYPTQELVKPDDWETLVQMITRLNDSTDVHDLVDGTLREQAVYGEFDGVRMKGLVDILNTNAIVDYKTYRGKLDRHSLEEQIRTYDYHAQGATYKHLTGVDDVFFLFQLTTYPYTPCIVQLSPQLLEEGKQRLREMMYFYKDSIDQNSDLPRFQTLFHSI